MCKMITDKKTMSFLEQIQKAVKKVPNKFWKVKRASSVKSVYRERVFCYELYHILRQMQDNKEFKYKFRDINAEIDKSGDTAFKTHYNPDFIFHTQGKDKQNFCAVELKVSLYGNSVQGVKKDFSTLADLIANHNYKIGVFILINNKFCTLNKRFLCKKNEILTSFSKSSISLNHLNNVFILTIINRNRKFVCKRLGDFLR